MEKLDRMGIETAFIVEKINEIIDWINSQNENETEVHET